jgi:hypothetical protein
MRPISLFYILISILPKRIVDPKPLKRKVCEKELSSAAILECEA